MPEPVSTLSVNSASLTTWRQRCRIRLAVLGLVALLLFGPILVQLYVFSQTQGSQHYSHFVLIPLIAGFFAFVDRRKIRQAACHPPIALRPPDTAKAAHGSRVALAAPLIVFSLLLYAFGSLRIVSLSLNDHLALMTTSLVLYIIGALLWILGLDAFHAARFPLLFLVFLIPIPGFLLQGIVVALQVASTAVVDALFGLSGTVYLRDGFVFSLPGMTIEVAEQCSGIRSSLSLFIVSILAGHMALRTTRGKIALALSVLPITVFKNGVRIVLLSLLAIHWDQAIMQGRLHRTGGIPFFVVAIGLLVIVLMGIGKLETRRPGPPKNQSEAPASQRDRSGGRSPDCR